MIFLYGSIALVVALVTLASVLLLKVSEARRVSKKPNCSYCGSLAMHVSAPYGLPDRLLGYWDCIPHRCEVCFHRQYRLAARQADDD